MNARHVSDAAMVARDVIYASLLRWQGQTITEEFARAEANNMGVAIVEALAQLAEESKPPPKRVSPEPCHRHGWCDLVDGHEGPCSRAPF